LPALVTNEKAYFNAENPPTKIKLKWWLEELKFLFPTLDWPQARLSSLSPLRFEKSAEVADLRTFSAKAQTPKLILRSMDAARQPHQYQSMGSSTSKENGTSAQAPPPTGGCPVMKKSEPQQGDVCPVKYKNPSIFNVYGQKIDPR
jgi:hypothetical protein